MGAGFKSLFGKPEVIKPVEIEAPVVVPETPATPIVETPSTPPVPPPVLDPVGPDGRELPTHEEKPALHLALIVGHTKESSGAEMHGTRESEYEFNSRIAGIITGMADGLKVSTIFRDNIGIKGAYEKANEIAADVCIELHFNAFNKQAFGTSTLCSTFNDDIEFAKIVHMFMCRAFERKDASRGVKVIPFSARGGKSVYSFENGPNCLVEPFFGDNEQEAKLAYLKEEAYATALIHAIKYWSEKKGL